MFANQTPIALVAALLLAVSVGPATATMGADTSTETSTAVTIEVSDDATVLTVREAGSTVAVSGSVSTIGDGSFEGSGAFRTDASGTVRLEAPDEPVTVRIEVQTDDARVAGTVILHPPEHGAWRTTVELSADGSADGSLEGGASTAETAADVSVDADSSAQAGSESRIDAAFPPAFVEFLLHGPFLSIEAEDCTVTHDSTVWASAAADSEAETGIHAEGSDDGTTSVATDGSGDVSGAVEANTTTMAFECDQVIQVAGSGSELVAGAEADGSANGTTTTEADGSAESDAETDTDGEADADGDVEGEVDADASADAGTGAGAESDADGTVEAEAEVGSGTLVGLEG